MHYTIKPFVDGLKRELLHWESITFHQCLIIRHGVYTGSDLRLLRYEASEVHVISMVFPDHRLAFVILPLVRCSWVSGVILEPLTSAIYSNDFMINIVKQVK